MRAAQRSADQGARSARADLTVGRYLTRWINDVVPDTVSAATEAQYRDVLRLYVIPRLGTKRLATLSPSDVDAMLRDMAKPTDDRPNGYSPTARRLARSILRLALRRAEAEGLITRNAAALSNSVRQDRQEGRSLTPDQARAAARRGERPSGSRRASWSPSPAVCVSQSCSASPGTRSTSIRPAATDRASQPQTGVGSRPRAVRDKTNRSRRVVHLTEAASDALRAHRVARQPITS